MRAVALLLLVSLAGARVAAAACELTCAHAQRDEADTVPVSACHNHAQEDTSTVGGTAEAPCHDTLADARAAILPLLMQQSDFAEDVAASAGSVSQCAERLGLLRIARSAPPKHPTPRPLRI